jgi:hypothetical protein
MRGAYTYSIHDIMTVDSEERLPELAEFRTQQPIDLPSIRVRIGEGTDHSQRDASPLSGASHIRYDEGLGPLGFAAEITVGDTIDVQVSPLLKWSPHVLYTNVVEPILRWAFVEKGYALVHGACLAFGSYAYLVTARTDTGKTTTILRILSSQSGATFISDDLTLVGPDGRALAYPKPLTISRHTVSAINCQTLSPAERLALVLQSRVHSRSGRHLAHFLAQTRIPMATINAVAQLLVPPPKYHIQRLIPGTVVTPEAKLARLFVIERGGDGEAPLDHAEAIQILLTNTEDAYGFPPYRAIEGFLCRPKGHDLRAREREILTQAFQSCPAVLLRSNSLDWGRRISALTA